MIELSAGERRICEALHQGLELFGEGATACPFYLGKRNGAVVEQVYRYTGWSYLYHHGEVAMHELPEALQEMLAQEKE
jgi:hypothetical protein